MPLYNSSRSIILRILVPLRSNYQTTRRTTTSRRFFATTMLLQQQHHQPLTTCSAENTAKRGRSSCRLHTTTTTNHSSSSLIRKKPRWNKPSHHQTASFSSLAAPTTSSNNSSMQDEYGDMTSEGNTFTYDGDYVLESGQILSHPQVRYQTYGNVNQARDNVVVVCHALTGNASLHAWWGDLLGPKKAFDTSQYYIVCCNILGSCYGSTSPQSLDGKTGQKYGMDFPDVSVKDTVALQLILLQQELNISSVKCVIGGSFGGMQAVEFAAQAGTSNNEFTTNASPFVRSVVPIACGACHTAWQIAISEVQRQAIYADPKWSSGQPEMATAGLAVARQMGMVSYRTPLGYHAKFGRSTKQMNNDNKSQQYQVKSYLEYQGQKFLNRFDPVTYVKLTEQMDTHDVGRNRGGMDQALSRIEIPALVLGIDSDVLYPLHEQEELAAKMPHAQLKIIESQDGHDGFLLEQDQVNQYIIEFLQQIM